tara:strand:- start:478 stop:618 length:141 start_codon:yes stop_codon:yes gene_type:complete
MSKGSNARPIKVPREEFTSNWDAIFGKKKEEPKEIPKDDAPKDSAK